MTRQSLFYQRLIQRAENGIILAHLQSDLTANFVEVGPNHVSKIGLLVSSTRTTLMSINLDMEGCDSTDWQPAIHFF